MCKRRVVRDEAPDFEEQKRMKNEILLALDDTVLHWEPGFVCKDLPKTVELAGELRRRLTDARDRFAKILFPRDNPALWDCHATMMKAIASIRANVRRPDRQVAVSESVQTLERAVQAWIDMKRRG